MHINPPSHPISNEYWRNCASAINKEVNSSRTGMVEVDKKMEENQENLKY